MARKIRRMTWTDRLIIEKLFNSHASYRTIAKRLGFSVAAVYKEVQRGLCEQRDGKTWKTYKAYSATIAQDDADWQASAKGYAVKLGHNHAYARTVSARILSGESPDQIVGDLRSRREWTVSTPTLYRYIDQGYIPNVTNKDLWQKSKRKKRKYQKVRASRAPKGTSIERRPSSVASRSTFGHWEMDSVIGKAKGKKQSLLVLTERQTRFEIIFRASAKTSAATVAALSHIVPHFPEGTFQTIAVDNGSEFQDADGIQALVPGLFYCHPYTSCERASNENANRIIRRFLPKGQSLRDVKQKDCDAVARFMNNMHRKVLGYRTAAELFQEQLDLLRQHNAVQAPSPIASGSGPVPALVSAPTAPPLL